jgi:hypothetical protein
MLALLNILETDDDIKNFMLCAASMCITFPFFAFLFPRREKKRHKALDGGGHETTKFVCVCFDIRQGKSRKTWNGRRTNVCEFIILPLTLRLRNVFYIPLLAIP